MLINIKPLLCGDVNIIEFDYPLSSDDIADMPDIDFSAPVAVKGKITNSAGYMEATIETEVEYDTSCARCLAPIHQKMTVSLVKSVAEENSLVDSDNEDYIVASGDNIEIDSLIAEQISLELPTRHLCSEDCKGLCPKCGQDLNAGSCSCVTKEIDPRLEILKQLFN